MATREQQVRKARVNARSEVRQREGSNKLESEKLEDLREKVRMAEWTLAQRKKALREVEQRIEDNEIACFKMKNAVDVLVFAETARANGQEAIAEKLEDDSLESILRYTGHNSSTSSARGLSKEF